MAKGKDPAFLFYPGDWLGGTIGFTRAHKGAYMDLLMAQFNQGRMDLHTIEDILGSDFETMWERKLKAKFKQDETGKFYNERLDIEQSKRRNFSQSRRNNLNGKDDKGDDISSHTGQRMENENENINENKSLTVIENIDARKIKFIEGATEILKTDDVNSLNAFLDYWTEKNPQGKKMRFELQKVFDVKRRFSTWLTNNQKWNGTKQTNSSDRSQRTESVAKLKNLSEAILDDYSNKNGSRSI